MPDSPLRRCLSLILLLLFVVSLVAVVGTRVVSAADAPIISAPNELAVTAPLGTRTTRFVQLTNTASTAVRPSIYEAHPAPPPAPAGVLVPPAVKQVPLPEQPGRVDPRLETTARLTSGGTIDFLIYLHDQADLSAAYAIDNWRSRGEYVHRTLVEHAERTQAGLRRELRARGVTFKPFWIVNAIRVSGTLADAHALAARSDVALVRANSLAQLPPAPLASTTAYPACNPEQPDAVICWNVRAIGADRVWNDFGVTGAGVTVAGVDTGVAFEHPALASQYRGYIGPETFDHNYNWYDPQGTQPAPIDQNGHGTHTMGTIAGGGDGTTARPAVGVAPGVDWIAAQGCDTYTCSESDLILAAQWLLAPTRLDGTDPRPDLRAMIVNNSWAGRGGDEWYSGYTAAWRAAGVFPVFAAGNTSAALEQECGSISSPGDYPDVVAVGATEFTDAIATFSLIGPTVDGRMKPDFVAPGTYLSDVQGVLSTYRGDGAPYRALQGTSMATPHVAGAVALIWSANPTLIGDYDATYQILRDSALRLSDTRCGDPPGAPNSVYGHGRIDAYSAVARARVDIPWLSVNQISEPMAAGANADLEITFDAARVPGPGIYEARIQIYGESLADTPTSIEIVFTVGDAPQQARISGRVLNTTGAPLQAVVGITGGMTVTTDREGRYTLTLAYGTYDLQATAPSYVPAQQTLTVDSDRTDVDFVLEADLPQLAVESREISTTLRVGERYDVAVPIANTGTRPLYYQVQVPPKHFSTWRSDEPGGPVYAWVELPADATTLDLQNDAYVPDVPLGIEFPFFSYVYSEILVTSDGTAAFDLPFLYRGPSSNCLPASEILFYMIAPLRADLDPSQGGSVRYATIDDRFVLSYENVPLHDGPADQTYTFQVILHTDGRIIFQYRNLAELPAQLSVGVQRTPLLYDEIGCGVTAPIYDELAIELRPQVVSDSWLQQDVFEGVVPPGGQAIVTVAVTWVRPELEGPYRGEVRIQSNDPYHRMVALPVQLTTLPAAYETFMVQVRSSS